jgi:hypothetical protein
MSPTVHWILAIIAWSVALPWLVVCVFWDWGRWHWPFFPVVMQRHIEDGMKLLDNPKELQAGVVVGTWESRAREIILIYWGKQSPQLEAFNNNSGVALNVQRHERPEIVLRAELRALKTLDPS